MKRKTKLFMTFSALCLVVALGVIGIFAVKTLNMSVGGNITFSAEGLDFSISDGTFETTAGAEYPGVNTDNTKLKGFAMNTNTKESDVATQKASWTGLNLTMSSLGDVVLVFTVTNNMTENLVTTIEVTTLGTNTNNNMEIVVAGGTVTKGTPKEMSITFHIKDTNINAGLTGFSVAVNFAKEGATPGATASNPIDSTELPKLTFNTSTASNGCISVTNNGAVGEVVIPAYVKVGETTYRVTQIGSNAFSSSSISSVVIPDTVTEIGYNAFAYCKNIKSVVIPHSVKIIQAQAFWHSTLEEVVFNEGLEVIEERAFQTTLLKTIKLPKSLKEINGYAAFLCDDLTTVYADCSAEVLLGTYMACMLNNTEYVYIHKDVSVTNANFTKVGQEGNYYKYTETVYQNSNTDPT